MLAEYLQWPSTTAIETPKEVPKPCTKNRNRIEVKGAFGNLELVKLHFVKALLA